MHTLRSMLKVTMESIASLLLAAMMFLTVVDVVFRYFLARPLAASFELTEILLTLSIYFGLAIVAYSNAHIRIDLLGGLIDRVPLLARALGVTFDLILAVALLALSREMFLLGHGKSSEITPIMRIPLAPVAWLVALTMLVAAMMTLLNLVRPAGRDD